MRFREWACPSYSNLRDVTSGSVVQRPFFLCFVAFLRPLAPLAGAGTNPVAGAGRAGTVGAWEVFPDSTSLSLGVFP